MESAYMTSSCTLMALHTRCTSSARTCKNLMPENNRKPLLSGVMRWFPFTMVLANTGNFMQQPLLPLYLQELGASVVPS